MFWMATLLPSRNHIEFDRRTIAKPYLSRLRDDKHTLRFLATRADLNELAFHRAEAVEAIAYIDQSAACCAVVKGDGPEEFFLLLPLEQISKDRSLGCRWSRRRGGGDQRIWPWQWHRIANCSGSREVTQYEDSHCKYEEGNVHAVFRPNLAGNLPFLVTKRSPAPTQVSAGPGRFLWRLARTSHTLVERHRAGALVPTGCVKALGRIADTPCGPFLACHHIRLRDARDGVRSPG